MATLLDTTLKATLGGTPGAIDAGPAYLYAPVGVGSRAAIGPRWGSPAEPRGAVFARAARALESHPATRPFRILARYIFVDSACSLEPRRGRRGLN
jgi:hypothetical protein